MNLSPQRRRRALEAHHLRQHGLPLRVIAKQLGVSHATVHSDLKLLETHWSEIAQAVADDLLLDQLSQLRQRLAQHMESNPYELLQGEQLRPPDQIRLFAVQMQEFNTLCREIRRTAEAVQRRARQRLKEQPAEAPDYPEAELTDAPRTRKRARPQPSERPTPAEPGQPELTTANHVNGRSPQPAKEMRPIAASQENAPADPDFERLLSEAQTFLAQLSPFADAAGG